MINQNKIILGTAQFGAKYGINNKTGKLKSFQIKKILNFAKKKKINYLDTSINYGVSQKMIGINNNNFKIITKLPKIPNFKSFDKIESWIKNEVDKSLADLNKKKLYAILLHNPEQLLSKKGKKIFAVLNQLKKNKKINKIGISIYSINILKNILPKYPIDIVQAPLNILDRRILEKSILKIINIHKIELHVRSIFLQGLLISKKNKLPKKFNKWAKIFKIWFEWVKFNKVSKLQACISFVLMQKNINKIVIGIDNLRQLKEFSEVNFNLKLKFPKTYVKDEKLINPNYWN